MHFMIYVGVGLSGIVRSMLSTMELNKIPTEKDTFRLVKLNHETRNWAQNITQKHGKPNNDLQLIITGPVRFECFKISSAKDEI
jgi:hypothetical protein